MTPAGPSRSLHGGTGGSVAVEFALVLPPLLMFLLGIIDLGRLAWTVSTLDFATSAAARCAAINSATCATVSLTQSYAVTQAPGMVLPTSVFVVTTQTCGDQVVANKVPFSFFSPWFPAMSQGLTATACYPSQP